MKSNLELLGRISDVAGVSGFEHDAQALVTAEMTPYADEIWSDRLGNVIALKRATKQAALAQARWEQLRDREETEEVAQERLEELIEKLESQSSRP